MKIVFTDTFDEDMRNIWDFIAQDNPQKASEVSEEIIDYCLKYLPIVPEMGQKLEITPEIRKLTDPTTIPLYFREQKILSLSLWSTKELRESGKNTAKSGISCRAGFIGLICLKLENIYSLNIMYLLNTFSSTKCTQKPNMKKSLLIICNYLRKK